MTATQNQHFVHAYSNLLVRAWTDKSYAAQLQQDPTNVAKSAHLGVKAGGTVTLDQSGSAQTADLDAQIAAWEAGDQSGKYMLYIPKQPQLGMTSANSSSVGETSYCCCCCPCCTCT